MGKENGKFTVISVGRLVPLVMRIFAFHLLNDYSGSPKVFMQLAKAWSKNNIQVTICTSLSQKGFFV